MSTAIHFTKITLTSYHDDLLSFASNLDEPKPLYDLRHCRAASIGFDCLMVSWGFGGDRSIVVYRRLEQAPKKKSKSVGFDEQPIVGWVAVA
jgi:hypothetical protein